MSQADLQTVADNLAIRELVESYNDAVMRFDANQWGGNWAEDATWILPGMGDGMQGRANIVAAWEGAMSQFGHVEFFAFAGPIRINGDTATGRWYQQEYLEEKSGKKRQVSGVYEDEYVRVDGQWKIAKRTYNVVRAEEV